MPRFDANLTMLFKEVPFLARFEAAAKAGFKGVEYLFPYDYPKEQLADLLKQNGLIQVLHNVPSGDWAHGERGIACLPNRIGEYRDGIGRAIEYATALGCKQVNCLLGIPPAGADPELIYKTIIDNLKFASLKMKRAGILLVLEPLNTVVETPGFYLTTTKQVRAIINDVGSDNLKMQYDIYHQQIMEGDLTRTMQRNMDIIRHMQLADNPGRHEPGTGEINFPFLFTEIDKMGYKGWIGCEYNPVSTTEAGLGWVKPYLN